VTIPLSFDYEGIQFEGTLERPGGGHVGFYVGENDNSFLVYGGNQSNAVGFAWINKTRLLGARRPKYEIGEPKNVRKIILESGELSTNEQ
jgi:hypothetical protein